MRRNWWFRHGLALREANLRALATGVRQQVRWGACPLDERVGVWLIGEAEGQYASEWWARGDHSRELVEPCS